MTTEPVDIAWLLLCAALVLIMQAGFTALESGLVRSKNSINVAIKNFVNLLVAASVFWLFSFGLMFGSSADGLLGTSDFFFDSDNPFFVAYFVFQLGFIATATTLISGAVAERMRFGGYVVTTVLVAAVLYPVFGHWAWRDGETSGDGGADGWLRALGFLDFAGSTVVHSLGGWVALAAIVVLGPRIGRFGPGSVPIRGHDLPLTTVGVFLLWVGWYGFNGGSTLGLTPDVPAVILNTTVAATFSGLVGLTVSWLRDSRPDVALIMNSALAGLVAVTASSDIISPWRAALIGGVAAVVMRLAVVALERRRIDDAVGAVPVHLAAGIWGTLAVGLLGDATAFPDGASRTEQIGIQLIGIAVCAVWAFGLGYAALWLVNRHIALRIDASGELAGLNIAEHGASTEIADLLTDMDEQRRSGSFDQPVRFEPNTEVGQIAAEYNRVLAAIGTRTDSLQLLQRTAAAANESSSVEEALALVLDEVCAFNGWPVGHAFLAGREDPNALISSGVSRTSDSQRYAAFLVALQSQPVTIGQGLAGVALESRKPVLASSDDLINQPPNAITLQVVSLDAPSDSSQTPTVIPLDGPAGSRAAEWVALGIHAGVAVPIVAGTEAVGALEFFSEEPIPADGELLELLLTVGTQLGRVVERQRSEEARLRTLIDNMPACVYLRDLAGRFILVNRQYEDFWGVRDQDIRGRTLYDMLPTANIDTDPDAIANVDREVVATGATRRVEARFVRHGKEHVMADVRFPVMDGAGRATAVAGIDIDITEQKRNEAELAELVRRVETARDAAEEAGHAKSRFLANMSHELRTPLNAIIGFSRLVSRHAETLPAKQADNLSKILISAEQLLGLIDEILDLSRIEAGELRIDPSQVEVAEVVREAVASLEPLVHRPHVELRVNVEPNPPSITTDQDKLRQILLNLVSNAIKYTDIGTIEVRTSVTGDRVHIAISDTGVGIPPVELPKVFDEFHRVASTRAGERRGTGLGLTISRRLARALGGDISAESHLGVGSTFTVDLPLQFEASGNQAAGVD